MGNLIGLVMFLGVFAGWLNHLYVCFTEQMWGFLIAGAIFFPIGVVHGWGLWLGFWQPLSRSCSVVVMGWRLTRPSHKDESHKQENTHYDAEVIHDRLKRVHRSLHVGG
ncbi:hypothetical protein [Agrobacterium pusense]|uniref:hypothetical protein n=1 Tax=Agrobacterium pusense TaxID=648995 RepID=UPI00126A64C6|nr:hypothetical protein [Agrobacterium pusense]QWW75904.1 hypothetical protein KP800_21950 [Agrobacterium pusense]